VSESSVPTELAAVDLGSNSFHMIVARVVDGELQIVDRLRDPVRLAAGLDHKNHLDPEAQARAVTSLARFGDRLRDLAPSSVRVVGTNTLRKARSSRGFLRNAEAALGHAIEIIPGQEEARLIYLGVAHDLSDDSGRRLVVDIGGGSTECIVGERFESILCDSLHMGCVSYTRQFFADGRIDRDRFRKAELAAGVELRGLEGQYAELEWTEAVGASGTIEAIASWCESNGQDGRSIRREDLRELRKRLIACGDTASINLPGISSERAAVLPGGLAILRAVFGALEIESMHASRSALREGLLYDLLGRIRHEDLRDRTIRRLEERFAVEREHGRRVERTVLHLFDSVAEAWDIDREAGRRFLSWAARLHEIGLAISHSGYHKHGAYLVANSDLPGLSRTDSDLLAFLIRTHRRKITDALLKTLPPGRTRSALRLSALLRIAVVLERGRRDEPLPDLRLRPELAGLSMRFPEGWFADRPLLRADLENAASLLAVVGFVLLVDEFRE
jgi:exopolyphosphatase/guanosine-5'-triphosphate,3'-diphosphate pyrophosphatase